VVVEPGQRSLQTAKTVFKMANGLGVRKVFVVANKVRGPEDISFIKDNIKGIEFLGSIAFNHAIMEADMKGSSPYLYSSETVNAVRDLKKNMEREL